MATTSSSTTATRIFVSESRRSSDSDLSSTAGSSLPSSNPSLIDRLRAPQKSILSCKRVIRKNKPGSHRKKRPFCSTDPKSVTPVSRVREFPNENLTVSAGKLFCSARREEVSLKRSIISNHIASAKHKQSKTKLVRKERRERDIAGALAIYDEYTHPRG